MPTASAPAARASSALAPAGVNTATRTALPVPAGSTVEPRTCWSDFLASTPRRTATSTASTNLALLLSLMIFSASSRSEEHTSELQSLMRISYAVFCLTKTRNMTCQCYLAQQDAMVGQLPDTAENIETCDAHA